MEEEEGNGRIAIDGLGSIDDQGVKEKVIGLLEGGPDALECAKKNMEYNDSFIGLFSISLT